MVLIFGGFALIAVGVMHLDQKCASDIKESSEYRGQAQVKLTQDGKNRNRTTQEFSAALNLTQAPPHQPEKEGAAHQEAKTWWDKFKCDVKIGDAVIAWLTWCLAVVGVFQALYLRRSIEDTGKAADAARIGAQVAHNDFIANHRPKLIVRRMALMRVDGKDGTPAEYWIRFMTVNIGETVATEVTVVANMWIEHPAHDGPLPFELPYTVGGGVPATIQGGEGTLELYKTAKATTVAFIDGEIGYAKVSGKQSAPLFFFGLITYKDARGVQRETAFIREYNFVKGGFVPSARSEYEYQD